MSLIDINNIEILGWKAAIRGMRNSRQSWDLSDSIFFPDSRGGDMQSMGGADLKLAASLAKKGGSHAKFRRMIHTSMDINAPLYWWKEFDTYKIGTTANSTSTMYSITDKKFEIEDFANNDYSSGPYGLEMIRVIETLNTLREEYLKEEHPAWKKLYWDDIIRLLPESYKQLRTVDLNYEVIARIVKERKGHKLKEWEIFINYMKFLPYAKPLIFCEDYKPGEENYTYSEVFEK